MNIFEDLVDELKKDNLLEETIVEKKRSENQAKIVDDEIIEAQTFLENYSKEQNSNAAAIPFEPKDSFDSMREKSESGEKPAVGKLSSPVFRAEPPKPPVRNLEIYRKRATDEVSCLQIVEHIFSGVEREQMKFVPKQYDDLEVTKSLHNFLQIANDIQSPEHAQAEFQLMQETESWYSALSHRDKHISVAHLRRFCETTRPALSPAALIALARFYRNSPYSESVRNKFDFVVTRLFSHEIGNEKREILLHQDDLIESLTELYAEWESISIFQNDENDSKSLITTLKFEDFMTEVETADSFDELLRNDFFNRLHIFKESTTEQFFIPLVTATAIESNIRIGNRYVELLQKEREKGAGEKLENKYGFLHDQVISDATSKTLQLVEVLNAKNEQNKSTEESEVTGKSLDTSENIQKKAKLENAKAKAEQKPKRWYSVNKWLLIATILAVISSVAIFVWSNSGVIDKTSQDVKIVNLENSSLKDFLKDARINNDKFYAVVLPSWDSAKREKKEEILQKILTAGTEKGYKTVFLLNNQGIAVGFASEEKVEVY